jgi:hypothetical protein
MHLSTEQLDIASQIDAKVPEAVRLTAPDIDSARMVIGVDQGKAVKP